jgi:protein tyrosine/serine phosphatase
MPASEFKEWLIFAAEEPFGDARAEYLAAMIAFTHARVAGSKKSKFADFLLFNKKNEDTPKAVGAQVQDAFLKASSGLKKRVIMKRKQ